MFRRVQQTGRAHSLCRFAANPEHPGWLAQARDRSKRADRSCRAPVEGPPSDRNVHHHEPWLRWQIELAGQLEEAVPQRRHVEARQGGHCRSHVVLSGFHRGQAFVQTDRAVLRQVQSYAIQAAPLRLWSESPEERARELWWAQASENPRWKRRNRQCKHGAANHCPEYQGNYRAEACAPRCKAPRTDRKRNVPWRSVHSCISGGSS